MARTAGGAPSTRRVLVPFLATATVVVAALAVVLVLGQHRAAVAEAVRDARTLTEVQARDVVGGVLTDEALAGGAAGEALDARVRAHVLGDQVVRVKVWDADGRVVWSDDAGLVGQRFPLPEDELAVLRGDAPSLSEVSDLDEPENAGEAGFGRLLQVYVGVRTPEGTPLLFEAYHRYDSIDAATGQSLRSSLPPLLGGLLLLWLLQAPLAWTLARRLRTAHEEREGALLRALTASDRERRRIAADLHDGVVQGLSGTALSLSAAASATAARGETAGADVLRSTAADLRRWVRELRTLVVTVTPPALHEQGLRAALVDLAAVLELRGCAVDVRVEGDLGPGALDLPTESLVFRAAQEAVRNTVKHAGADRVDISLVRAEDDLVLEVTDDGAGYDPGAVAPRRRGSVGLELLGSLALQQDGRLTTRSSPGRGTTVALRLPVPRPRDGRTTTTDEEVRR
ncbi:sensor histidine kinase [Pseudokineococcus lusitanus]|uniref:Histidine kinase/DNA gyrase B/HSP90-like ATPase n=1 Tax=Pseudokineococcus lusitanus TaxID=763993 RepID=A0A3N1GAH4_9ACTN|nr:ATP-binding protein [Pseudokineococcus lusitanus]ROP27237.1 histidine kinase/DNA gyrase B/HSP90-like ATPase [Pseudokineococcus lusitanus]